METILYASMALSVLILAGAAVFIFRRRSAEKGLICLRETWMTAVLGIMLAAIGFAVCAMKLTDPAAAGEGRDSYLFVAGFQLICQLLGAFCLLFTFVKKVVAFDGYVLSVSSFGKVTRLPWKDVVSVEKPLTRRAVKLTGKKGEVITVSGDSKGYPAFLAMAKTKVRPAQGKELLDQVEHRLRLR